MLPPMQLPELPKDAWSEAEQAKINQILLIEVNNFQNELYNFKMKSHEIHKKIQHAIDLVNSEILKHQFDNLQLLEETGLDELIRCFSKLKLEIEKAKILIAEVRKHSECPNETKDIQTKQRLTILITKLNELKTLLTCNMMPMKWAKIQSKLYFPVAVLPDKFLKLEIAKALLISKPNPEELPLPLKHKYVPIPGSSLSEALTTMNNMISHLSKLSCRTSTYKAPTSASPSTVTNKSLPASTLEPLNIHNTENCKPETPSLLIDSSSVFRLKQNFSSTFEPLLCNLAPPAAEKQKPTYEYKYPNIFSGLGKLNATDSPTTLPLSNPASTAQKQIPTFDFKPSNIFRSLNKSKPTNPALSNSIPTTADKQVRTFEFKPTSIFSDLGISKPNNPPHHPAPPTAEKQVPTFDFKPSSIFSDLNKLKATGPPNDPSLSKSIPTTAENQVPTFDFKPTSIFSDLGKPKPNIPLNNPPLSNPTPPYAEKHVPIFDFKPSGMFSDLSKLKATDPPNDSVSSKSAPTIAKKQLPTFEFKPTSTFSGLDKLNATDPATNPPLSNLAPPTVEKQVPTFKLKNADMWNYPANVLGELRVLQTTCSPNDPTLSKPAATTAKKQVPTFEFKPLITFSGLGKLKPTNEPNDPAPTPPTADKQKPTFEVKPTSIFSDFGKPKPTDPLNDPALPKPTTNTEKQVPTFEFKPLITFSGLGKLKPTNEPNDPAPTPPTADKQKPTFEVKPTSIFSDFGKPKPTDPLNDPALSKPTTTTEKQVPTFESVKIFCARSKPKKSIFSPNDPASSKPTTTTAEQVHIFRFKPISTSIYRPDLGRPNAADLLNYPGLSKSKKQVSTFEFQPLSTFTDLGKPKPTNPLNDPASSKPTTTAEKQVPTFEFKSTSGETKPKSTESSRNLFNFSEINTIPNIYNPFSMGTTHVKYNPVIEIEGVVKSGGIPDKLQCITCMKEFEDKSLEELRLGDMMAKNCSLNGFRSQQQNELFFRKPTGTARMHFIPPTVYDVDASNQFFKYKNQCITCMKEYEDRSLEELRLEDYIEGRKGLPQSELRFPLTPPIRHMLRPFGTVKSTAHVKYNPQIAADIIVEAGVPQEVSIRLLCITCMKEYENNSLEELRLEDYRKDLLFGPQHEQTSDKSFTSTTSPLRQEQKQEPTNPMFKSSVPSANNTPAAGEPFGARIIKNVRRRVSVKRPDVGKTQDAPLRQEQKQETKSVPESSSATDANSKPTAEKTYDTVPRIYKYVKRRNPEQHENKESTTQDFQTRSAEGSFDNPTQKSQQPKNKSSDIKEEKPQRCSTPQQMAEDKNEAGVLLYKQEKYEDAIEMFNAAIELCTENSSYFSNRASALLMLGKHKQALEDLQTAAAKDPMCTSQYIRIAKCCLSLGDIATGEQAVRRAVELSGASCVRREAEAFSDLRKRLENARKLMDNKSYYDALPTIDYCLKHYNHSCTKTKLMKAECLAMVKRYQEAQDIAINISLFERTDADAYYIIGLCSFYQNKEEIAVEYFQKCLKHEPDHKKAQTMFKKAKLIKTENLLKLTKHQGNEAFNKGNWQEALRLYNKALEMNTNNIEENAKLYFNTATVYAKLNETMLSAQACTQALELNGNYVKALLRRAQCFTELNYHDEAVEDYEKLYKINRTSENKRFLDEANKAKVKFKQSNYYYKIMGVKTSASPSDIKRAYRNCALLYHSDRYANAGSAWKQVQDNRFKLLGEAYEVLQDKRKRANYDRNQCYDDEYDDDDYHDDDDDDEPAYKW